MAKKLFIAEKPSVAREFASALGASFQNGKGFMESEEYVITWCVGHLVGLSYPEAYGEEYRRWSFDTLPFIPDSFRYEVLQPSKDQFSVVSKLLNRKDVDTIYVCTDSGREGEYIYRLVDDMAKVSGKAKKRVWIDSQTHEEILRGIREAKDLTAYDRLSDAAYLRAKVDYLMGINFSRALSLRYSGPIKSFLARQKAVVSVGRVMTCVLGIVVQREWEIRNFVKTAFYKVNVFFSVGGGEISAEWRLQKGSMFEGAPDLYKDSGFLKEEDANRLVESLKGFDTGTVQNMERKKEVKNPPLLYNLAELQNDCAKYFKISPDQTLGIAQELYEKKLTTYPRTDARVLSTAVAKEITKNLKGLTNYAPMKQFAEEALQSEALKKLPRSRYVNDKQITDHYALIPTGQGINGVGGLSELSRKVYDLICARFLSIFFPPAIYKKVSMDITVGPESFHAGFKNLEEEGYLKVFGKKAEENKENKEDEEETSATVSLEGIKKGSELPLNRFGIKTGETTPPKRYTSGTMILTMENAGQFIEDEELRAQIKGSGIGTSATRAEILGKLVKNGYLNLNKKTQVLTPALYGELICEVVKRSIISLLNPALTASWEKGLSQVEEGSVTPEVYMEKLRDFINKYTDQVKYHDESRRITELLRQAGAYYRK